MKSDVSWKVKKSYVELWNEKSYVQSVMNIDINHLFIGWTEGDFLLDMYIGLE